MSRNEAVQVEVDDLSEEFSHCFTGECRVNVLPMLCRVSKIISECEDLAKTLKLILSIMRTQLRVHRGVITLYDRESQTIFIHQSFGLSEDQKARGIYAPG